MSIWVGNGRCTMKPPPSRVRRLLMMRTTLREDLGDGFMDAPMAIRLPRWGRDATLQAGHGAQAADSGHCSHGPVLHPFHIGMPLWSPAGDRLQLRAAIRRRLRPADGACAGLRPGHV